MTQIDKEEIKVMTEIARLYYEEGKTQEEIGKIFNFSRIKVLRILNKAREEGIVTVKVIDPLSTCKDLERELEKKFNLEKAIVVPGGDLPKSLVVKGLGKWGSLLFQEMVQDGDIVGIGWGLTVFECVKQLGPVNKVGVTVVPLGGGTGQIDPNFQVNELAKSVANKLKARWYPLDVPIFVENKKTKDVLFDEPKVRKVIELWDKLSIVLIGIGNISSLWEDYSSLIALSRKATEVLKEQLILYKSIGNLVLNYFDINGNISPISIRENILSISLDKIKRTKRIIALSGGEDKKEAVLGALRLGCITHLVTDESVANYLLQKSVYLEPNSFLVHEKV